MKLDSLIAGDTFIFVEDEWDCELEVGPLKGSVLCTLIDHKVHKNGNVWLKFDYINQVAMSFIGYRVVRWWMDWGTVKLRTVATDAWTPAKVLQAGARIEIEVIVEPKDWA